MWPMMTASQLTCWRGPLLVHGNYKSSLFYFCVYVTKETVHPSQHFRSELPNSCNIFHQCNLGIMKPDSLFFSDYCETKWNPPWYKLPFEYNSFSLLSDLVLMYLYIPMWWPPTVNTSDFPGVNLEFVLISMTGTHRKHGNAFTYQIWLYFSVIRLQHSH